VLIAVVSVEVLILIANGWRCPLTAVAARYTDDKRDNFDIYLPALARAIQQASLRHPVRRGDRADAGGFANRLSPAALERWQ
jgi:hypothetical protein